MSLVLHIWESPVPADFAEAAVCFERLRDVADAGPQSKLDELLRRLVASFPEDIESTSRQPVWMTRLQRCIGGRAPVVTVCIATRFINKAGEFLLERALELGLVVCDPEHRTVFLPDGWIRGTPPALFPRDLPGSVDKLDQADATARVVAALVPVFGMHGFAHGLDKESGLDGFSLSFEGGRHRVTPFVFECGNGIAFTFDFQTDVDAVDELKRQAFGAPAIPEPIVGARLGDYVGAVLPQFHGLMRQDDRHFLVGHGEDIDVEVSRVAHVFLEHVLPVLRRFESPASIVEQTRSLQMPILPPGLLTWLDAFLAAARLCGRPALEELEARLVAAWEREGATAQSAGDLHRAESARKNIVWMKGRIGRLPP